MSNFWKRLVLADAGAGRDTARFGNFFLEIEHIIDILIAQIIDVSCSGEADSVKSPNFDLQ